MQRVKVFGGRMTLDQWQALAEIALRYTPNSPIHLTTRQDIEFHGVQADDVAALQRGLAAAGLTTVGACGDTLRNVTLCPGCGLCEDTYDLAPVADSIRRRTQALPWIFSLPRKFKISLSGCGSACARPWINDIGFVADEDGSFVAILAGSLGPRPNTGILCYEGLKTEEILPLTVAALRLFQAEGDRKNRSSARLRHVRERLGDESFRRRLDVLFREERTSMVADDPPMSVPKCEGPTFLLTQAHLPHGDIKAETLQQLAEDLQTTDCAVRIGFEHDLLLYGVEPDVLPKELQALIGIPCVLACPGAHLCNRGIVETWEVADAIQAVLPKRCDVVVSVSGCPNNCPHAAVADIGLIGRIKTVDGERRSHYRLLTGGGKGMTPELGQELHSALAEDRVAEVVRRLVSDWSASPTPSASPTLSASPSDEPTSFGDFIARESGRLKKGIEERAARKRSGPESGDGVAPTEPF